MKLAQALLLRKQLHAKVAQLEPLKQQDPRMFEIQTRRVNITDTVDEVSLNVPKITLANLTAEYDKYSSALRKIDAAIQQANWQFDLPEFTDAENPFNDSPVAQGSATTA